MEEVKMWKSFDGNFFNTEEKCKEYEKDLKSQGIKECLAELSRMKSKTDGALHTFFENYNHQRKLYIKTCNEKTNQKVRAERLFKMVNAKVRYEEELSKYQRTKKRLVFLKKQIEGDKK